jgi:hypothetical protein
MVADNFHYGDKDETYTLGNFDDLDAAISAAMGIVDEYLESAFTPGMTADALYDSYTSFGEDPYIISAELDGKRFSAWQYAKQRSAAICAGAPAADDEGRS